MIDYLYKVLFQDKVLFTASEVFLLISIGTCIRLYQHFIQPSEFVKSGIEAIKDKDFTIKFVPTGKGEVDTLIEVYNLMIDQLREERTKLHEQHFFLEKLLAASPIAILILDFNNQIATLNTKAELLLKIPPGSLSGKNLDETDLPLLAELGTLMDGESRIMKTNGVETYKVQRSHFMDQGFRRSFLMIEELTAELLESEKKAYGKVIRMMAHEVNNTLGATDSILQTTRNFLNTADYPELNEALRIASERNQRLARFMRNFADVMRLPAPTLKAIDLGKLVQEVVVFMRPYATGNGIALKMLPTSETPTYLRADAGQMEQVLVNVIKNAIEACEAGQKVEVDLFPQQLSIRNTGTPISPLEAAQLFNPFFSSKPDGQGIGLTLTREILINHGFSFSLKTRQDG